jgi:hypothetical protein
MADHWEHRMVVSTESMMGENWVVGKVCWMVDELVVKTVAQKESPLVV